MLAILALIWGSSFILMKRGLESFSHIQLAALRLCIAGLVMLPFTVKFIKQVKRQDILPLTALALFGNGFPYFFFAYAQTELGSGITGALNSAVPLFTLIISALVLRVPTSVLKVVGVLVGLAGALTLVLSTAGPDAKEGNYIYGLWVIAATVCYAISINTVKTKLSHYKPLMTSSIPLTAVAIPLLIYIPVVEPISFGELTNEEWKNLGAIAVLGLFGTAIALILFNRLIQLSSAVFASTVTYLIPIVAMVWGFVDGEVISLQQVIGLAVVLGGVYLVNRKEKAVKA